MRNKQKTYKMTVTRQESAQILKYLNRLGIKHTVKRVSVLRNEIAYDVTPKSYESGRLLGYLDGLGIGANNVLK